MHGFTIAGLIALVCGAGAVWQGLTTPSDIRRRWREWKARNDVVTLQYNGVDSELSYQGKGLVGVNPRVFLDNPHDFALRCRMREMVTIVDHMHTHEISDKSEFLVGAGARNAVLTHPAIPFTLKKGQSAFPIRIIWEVIYWRDGVEPPPSKPTRLPISGVLRHQYYVGRASSQWTPDEYSDSPIQLPPEIVTITPDGELHAG